jgi:hypothetical protein
MPRLVNLFSERVQNIIGVPSNHENTKVHEAREERLCTKTIFFVTFVMLRVFVVSSW